MKVERSFEKSVKFYRNLRNHIPGYSNLQVYIDPKTHKNFKIYFIRLDHHISKCYEFSSLRKFEKILRISKESRLNKKAYTGYEIST
jgi:hypothetical protein